MSVSAAEWGERIARARAEIDAIRAGEWRDPSWSDEEYQRQKEMHALNAKLNASEEMLRQRIGRQMVTQLIRQFKAAAMADPRLFTALYKKRDPYRWLAQHWAPKMQTPIPQPAPPSQ